MFFTAFSFHPTQETNVTVNLETFAHTVFQDYRQNYLCGFEFAINLSA